MGVKESVVFEERRGPKRKKKMLPATRNCRLYSIRQDVAFKLKFELPLKVQTYCSNDKVESLVSMKIKFDKKYSSAEGLPRRLTNIICSSVTAQYTAPRGICFAHPDPE